jgi:hypothetical protein
MVKGLDIRKKLRPRQSISATGKMIKGVGSESSTRKPNTKNNMKEAETLNILANSKMI